MKRGSFIHHLERWLDECKMALSGIVLATREYRFLIVFFITFIVFGTLLTLLSGGAAAWNLFWATDLSGKMAILGNGFLGIFGVNRSFFDWLLTFSVTLLQSILIGLVALVWAKRRRRRAAEKALALAKNANNVQGAGIAAGLAILGSGCPTCGTTLLAPVIGAFVSSGSYVLAGVISGLITAAAIIIALFALKRIGKDAFVMITCERYEKRHAGDTAAHKSHSPKTAKTANQKGK